MLKLLQKISQKVDLNLALAVFGTILALFAIGFDWFGFRVDRSESRQSTSVLEQIAFNTDNKRLVLERVSPEALAMKDQYLLSSKVDWISPEDERILFCSIHWEMSDGSVVSIKRPLNEDDIGFSQNYQIAISRPDVMYLFDSLSDSFVGFEGSEQSEPWLFFDISECNAISELPRNFRYCLRDSATYSRTEIVNFANFGDVVVTLDQEKIPFKEAPVVTNFFEKQKNDWLRFRERKIEEFNELYEQVRSNGGKLETGQTAYTIDRSNVENYPSPRPKDQITMTTNNPHYKFIDRWRLAETGYWYRDADFEMIEPGTILEGFWLPDATMTAPSMNLETEMFPSAVETLDACDDWFQGNTSNSLTIARFE